MSSRRLPCRPPALLAIALCAAVLLSACGGGQPGSSDGGQTCQKNRDCPSGMGCVSNVCQALPCGGCQPDELCADDGACKVAQGTTCPAAGCPTGYQCSGTVCAKPCTLDSNCDKGFVCNSALNTCAQCTFDTQCAAISGKPRCDSVTGNCVACTQPSDCGHGSFCNTSTHSCTPGCKVDGDCNVAGGERCDGATASTPGRCIQCTTDTECYEETTGKGNPLAKACDPTGHCVQCTADKFCTLGVPRCDAASKTCVQCLPANNAVGKDCGCFLGGPKSACPNGTTAGDPHDALTCNPDNHSCVDGCQFDTQCGCPKNADGSEQNCPRAPHTYCCKDTDCNPGAGDTCVGANAQCGATGGVSGKCSNGGKVVVAAGEYCDKVRRTNNFGQPSLGACGECSTDTHCRYRISGQAPTSGNYQAVFANLNGSRCSNARCIEGCDADIDCPASKICHLSTNAGDTLNHQCVQCGCDGATTFDNGSWCEDDGHCGTANVCDAKTLLCRKKRFTETCSASTECGDINDPAINTQGSTACLPAAICVKEFKADAAGLGDFGPCKVPGLPLGRCGIPCQDRNANLCIAGAADGLCPFNSICRSTKDDALLSGPYCVPASCR